MNFLNNHERFQKRFPNKKNFPGNFFPLIFPLILSFLVFVASLPADESRFFLRNKVVLSTDQVRLSDIVRWKEAWNPILKEGIQEPIYWNQETAKHWILEAFRKEGKPVDNLEVQGNGTWILPLTENIPTAILQETLEKEIRNESNLGGEDFRITLLDSNAKLPKTGFQYEFRKIGKEIRAGKRIFPLDLVVKEDRVHSIPLSFLVETKKTGFVPVREIPNKQVIEREDIRKIDYFDAESGMDVVTEDPVGKTALGILPEGKPILKKQIRLLNTIERGQEVQLLVTTDTILIKARARALESGNEGDTIRVMNLTSTKILSAEVKSSGICEVKN